MASEDLTESGYYYNVSTGQVEKGLVSSWTDRMGPYPTEEDAAAALAKARDRSEAWDEADRKWEND